MSYTHEFVIIMYKADHVHPKWVQLAPLSIQYQASGTEELFNWHAAKTNAKYTRAVADSSGRSPVFLCQKLRASTISDIPISIYKRRDVVGGANHDRAGLSASRLIDCRAWPAERGASSMVHASSDTAI